MRSGKPRLCAAIVLYCQEATQSVAIRTFAQMLRNDPGLASEVLVCVYDNSPHPAALPRDLFACDWRAFQPGRNNGLAEAYNTALEVAEQSEIKWLLVLDSDTEVTEGFLKACLACLPVAEADDSIAALIPHIAEGGTMHSPRFAGAWRRRALDRSFSGVVNDELIAVNSGSVLRVSAVRSIGGFNPEFWLDYLDYWLFRSLHTKEYSIFVLPETLTHSLSFADATSRMPQERYENMLAAERYFTIAFGSRWERIRLKLVLLKRLVTFGLRGRNASFARATLRELLRFNTRTTPPRRPSVPRLTNKS